MHSHTTFDNLGREAQIIGIHALNFQNIIVYLLALFSVMKLLILCVYLYKLIIHQSQTSRVICSIAYIFNNIYSERC